jgi:hypothetical protein
MRGRSYVVAAALLLLAPLSLAAQVGGRQGGMGQAGGGIMMARALADQGSVEFLVAKAADMQLNAAQVEALQAIAAQWAEENKKEREQLKAIALPGAGGAGAGGDRQALMQQFQTLMPVAQKVQQEDEKAVAEALKGLSETQQAAAKKLLEERVQSMRVRRGG